MNAQIILAKGKLKRFLTLSGRHLHIDMTNPVEAEHLYKAIKDQLMGRGWAVLQTQKKFIPKKQRVSDKGFVTKKFLNLPYRTRER